ncbi:alpha/beta fold hydrolase [Nocardia asteroides]|uniref:alpha/beta fold hydrolase n=1 Tax=Nocardia asteroides TaxID=1824 RepID=UPI001E631A5B|nr:alpha/beta hydrolase [Nocardia asteroides]UGT54635.1 alpha/beta hydrolase [Nocardia asteroides]
MTATALAARVRAVEDRVADTYGLRTTEHTLSLRTPAVRVRVRTTEDPGPPVVWINGIGAPAMAFAPLLALLPGYRHLLVDLPGHNLAPPYRWQGLSLRDLAVDVVTGTLDELGLARTLLVGSSLGGLFALWTALDAPHRVTGIATLGAPATALPGTRPTAAMVSTARARRGRIDEWSMRLPAPRMVARAALAQALGADTARGMSDDLVDLHSLPLRLPGQAASYRALLRRLIQDRAPRPETVLTDAELARIDRPALFVWGERDVFAPPERARPSIAKIPGARLAVVPGGHSPWLDDTASCAALLDDFLARLHTESEPHDA